MQTLFNQLESNETAARHGVASGLRQFLASLSADSAVRSLIARTRKEPEQAGVVFKRLTRLAEEEIDPRYEHPSDTAMAAYLIILNGTDESLYRTAAEVVAGAQNIWWAKKLVDSGRRSNHTSNEVFSSLDFRVSDRNTFEVSDSLEAMIPVRVTYTGRTLLRPDTSVRRDANSAFAHTASACPKSTPTTPTRTLALKAA